MLTMVYTTLSYTVVYNLFFIVVCVCLLGMCNVSDIARMDMPFEGGSGGEIQAASLSCVQQKGLNMDVTT